MQVLNVKENDKLLIIAPHPDDECIGAGGVLALYASQCMVIVLSDGREGQGMVPAEAEKEIRKAEFCDEMSHLGIADYRMLGYEDGTLMQHLDCLEMVDLSPYTKIFVTGVHDGHPDHKAACLGVYQALRRQGIKDTEIYFYEVHAPLQEVTHMLDITDVIGRKLRLIRFHQSQLGSMPYDRYAESMAGYRALQNRMEGHYIETYTRMSPEYDPYDTAAAELDERLQKSILFYQILTRWVEMKIKGYSIAEVIKKRGFYKVAVYGYAEIGKLLCQELAQAGMEAAYVLDRKVTHTEDEKISVFVPQKGLPEVDAVVVTAVYYFHEIEKELIEMGFHNIVSLRDLMMGSELR